MFLAEGVGRASIASDRGSAPRKGMERFLQPMGERRAEPRRSGQWEARVPGTTTEPLRGASLRDVPTHTPRRPVQSGGSSPQSSDSTQERRGFPSSNQEASGRRRERVEWLSGPEYCSDRGLLLLVCRGDLVSVFVPLRWLLVVVVVAEQPVSWARGFRDVGSSPTVVGWSPV